MEALLIVPGLIMGFAILWVVKLVPVYRQWGEFQAWRNGAYELAEQPMPPQPQLDPAANAILQGAGRAAANPPRELGAALRAIAVKLLQGQRYIFPLGWAIDGEDQIGLNTAAFVGDVNHILITGQSDVGKDNLALNILLALASKNDPQRLQVALLDGKGLDWAGWRGKAHTWALALDPDEIAPAMAALTQERKRRRVILEAAGVSKWDEYEGTDLPLLVAYISELSLLRDAVGSKELDAWLNSELAAGRAFGIRYIIATQTATNNSTGWRSQITLHVAGFQPAQHQDQPNTGVSTAEIRERGGIPPSELPNPPRGAGVFTALQGRMVETVRCSYLASDQRRAWLQRLPDVPTNHLVPRKSFRRFSGD